MGIKPTPSTMSGVFGALFVACKAYILSVTEFHPVFFHLPLETSHRELSRPSIPWASYSPDAYTIPSSRKSAFWFEKQSRLIYSSAFSPTTPINSVPHLYLPQSLPPHLQLIHRHIYKQNHRHPQCLRNSPPPARYTPHWDSHNTKIPSLTLSVALPPFSALNPGFFLTSLLTVRRSHRIFTTIRILLQHSPTLPLPHHHHHHHHHPVVKELRPRNHMYIYPLQRRTLKPSSLRGAWNELYLNRFFKCV